MYGGVMKELGRHANEQERLGHLSLAQIRELRKKSAKGKTRRTLPPLLPRERDKGVPLSHAQERLWFLDQLGLTGSAYNMRITLRLEGNLDLQALERSLTELVHRHESLRTHFESKGGSPVQVVEPAEAFALSVHDLSGLPVVDRDLEVQRRSNEEIHRPCNLAKGPLLRVSLLKLTDKEHVLLLTVHHIVFDGWSRGILHRELGALYSAYSRGETALLPDLPVQYPDFAIWQREWLQGEVLREHLQYWKEKLLGAPPQLQLPTDRPRPAVESFRGAKLGFELSATLSDALKDLAQREQATLLMAVLATYQILLARWSGQQDVVVGSPIAGRNSSTVENLIGFFVNMLMLRTEVSDDLTFRELLQQVKETTLQAYAHQDLPFEVLVKELRPERNLARQPIFQAVLAMRNFPEERLELPGLTWTWTSIESGSTHFDLTLYLNERPAGLSGTFEYASDLFDERTVRRMAGHFCTLVGEIVADPDRPIRELQMLSGPERAQVLQEFNSTSMPHPRDLLVHELVEARAGQSPDAVALVCGEQLLTYSELNRRASQVAHRLLELGIQQDDRVGLYVERGTEMIVGLLGILKAGGAYVPLDVSYPPGRLGYMLRDSSPAVVLTQEHLKRTLPISRASVIVLEAEEEVGAKRADDLVITRSRPKPEQLAYVIYTSGSTGTPKGVMIEHRNLLNLVQWHCAVFGVDDRCRCSCVAAVGFDAATWEIWPPLSAGATLVLAPQESGGDADTLTTWWASQRLDISFLPTPMAELAFSKNTLNSSLDTLLVGGDRLRLYPESKSFALVNNYGPTESTVVATSGLIEHDSIPHIGRPIANTSTYILDGYLRPVPLGVPGEIFIGGASVARGYLNQPQLTAERFIADPFDADPHMRMYRSGDLGRWRADGTIEYLGRNDHQVKIRGYRIELGEIEGQLLEHPHVREVAVVPQEQESGEKRLVAYLVADVSELKMREQEASDEASAKVVAQWEGLYEETYSAGPAGPSFVGWNSSYTGEPIPEAEMEEWRDRTVDRIRSLKPKKMLEIGCGVGLLLQQLARQCESYVGTDFSAAAIEQLRRWTAGTEGFRHVKLLQRSATELQDLPSGSFDTIVLNSVVQYFPDVDYLIAVLHDAVRLLVPGGNIFVGDVRHLGSLSMFHSAVQLGRAAATINLAQLRRRVARAIEQDKELVIDPQLFRILPARLPGLCAAEVQLKRGEAANELTRHRYDVVLRTGNPDASLVAYEQLPWHAAVQSVAEFEKALRDRRWLAVRLRSIPNSRLVREAAAQERIDTSDEQLEVGTLRRQLNELQYEAVDPNDVWRLGESYGYDVTVSPADAGCFDIQLLDRARAGQISRITGFVSDEMKPYSAYANDPLENGLRQQLIPQLREFLKKRVPEYMIPSAWVVLKELPLTANGKLDRRALPVPQSRPQGLGEYVAPRSEMERALADIWAQVLRVDQVGIRDNFFDLGGHSLLAVKALHEINQSLNSSLIVTDLYKSPTVVELATRIASSAADDEFVNLTREATLDAAIVANPDSRYSQARAILLTGATGFVGRFLLAQLLNDTDATIYCLVRSPSQHQALSRLRTMLARWDLWHDELESRIIAVAGDLRSPRLGIDSATYAVLSEKVDSVYHCGISMNHLETYAMAKAANVGSATELLKFATNRKQKLINYISTMGVFSSAGPVTRVVEETTPIDHERHSNSRGYLASKWVSEKIFMIANERGIPCNIFRLGLVWADSQLGRFDELQNAYRVFKSCLISGCGIENYRYAMAPTPVDYVARATVFLANRHGNGGGIFHISSPDQLAGGIFERCNEIAGTTLELMPYYDWICEMKRLQLEGQSLPVVPLVEFAFSKDETSFYEHQRRLQAESIQFDCTRTYREIERGGIVAPVLNDNLLRLCIESMCSRDSELQESIDRRDRLLVSGEKRAGAWGVER
jgi:amino acid adenylation domain-containing protein/thioester reductase-like protein